MTSHCPVFFKHEWGLGVVLVVSLVFVEVQQQPLDMSPLWNCIICVEFCVDSPEPLGKLVFVDFSIAVFVYLINYFPEEGKGAGISQWQKQKNVFQVGPTRQWETKELFASLLACNYCAKLPNWSKESSKLEWQVSSSNFQAFSLQMAASNTTAICKPLSDDITNLWAGGQNKRKSSRCNEVCSHEQPRPHCPALQSNYIPTNWNGSNMNV